MIVYELTNTESHPVYRRLEVENGARQYSFMNSIVAASLEMGRQFLSQSVMKALNYHAIPCLHINAAEYRPCQVYVGPHTPIEFYRVPAAIDDFVNKVNRSWKQTDPVVLATYVLWRLNDIHPFINGNGRTAGAACYYVLCLRAKGLIVGTKILPELIKRERAEYCVHLQHAHDTFKATGEADIVPLHGLVSRLLQEQLDSAPPDAGTPPAPADASPAADILPAATSEPSAGSP